MSAIAEMRVYVVENAERVLFAVLDWAAWDASPGSAPYYRVGEATLQDAAVSRVLWAALKDQGYAPVPTDDRLGVLRAIDAWSEPA